MSLFLMVTFKVVVDYISFSTRYFRQWLVTKVGIQIERRVHLNNGNWFLNGKTTAQSSLNTKGCEVQMLVRRFVKNAKKHELPLKNPF